MLNIRSTIARVICEFPLNINVTAVFKTLLKSLILQYS